MCNKEAVVLILDANQSMNTSVGTDTRVVNESNPSLSSPSSFKTPHSSSNALKTRFECTKEAAIAIIGDLMVRSKTNEVTVVVLHTEETSNYWSEKDNIFDDDEEISPHNCLFHNISEFSGNGEVMDIRQPLPDLLRKIQDLEPNTGKNSLFSKGGGDFVSGIVYATDALYRRTSGKKFSRRIVLLTDAEHKVGSNDTDIDGDGDDDDIDEDDDDDKNQRFRVALDILRDMEVSIQVVGMGFEHAADFDTPASKPSKIKVETLNIGGENNSVETIDSDNESETGTESDDDDDDDDDDILEIKRKNEECLINLANMTGGYVYASKELKGMLEKVMGSRVVQHPSKRKLIVEIAPGLVLEDARLFLLVSKSGSTPLEKKLVMMDENEDVRTNAFGEEMLQDFESTITHWNVEDENEELLSNRISHAYRFGSDLLPFSPLDDAGLATRAPVKLSILGYTQKKIPQYMRVSPPYVLTGNESRRCCAAISALARGLQRTKRVAIATYVKSKDKDPILCGLFPLENGDKPLRLTLMQLPFLADVRIPWIEDYLADDVKENPKTKCACDELIDKLMLPDDVLDYKLTPNHKIRSFYKTVVKRVLENKCDVVSTRIINGKDSMDTPTEIVEKARSEVRSVYESFNLKKVPDIDKYR